MLCDDISLNRELIDTNVKEDLSNYEIVELKKLSQSKSNEKELAHIIYTRNKLVNSGLPNYQGCKIPVKTRINVEFFGENLLDYKDMVICEYLEFGAPIGFQGCLNVSEIDIKNHKGASELSSDIYKYLRKEASYGSIIGPFESNPFDCQFKISPLNSVTKRNSSERRVILDLSFPPRCSVNDNISKDIYLGEKLEVTYPKIDDLVGILKNKGRGSLMFKKDLKRAYRQFPICPGDLHLVGFNWNGYLFADRVLPMGLRSSAQICQRITKSITFMYFNWGI